MTEKCIRVFIITLTSLITISAASAENQLEPGTFRHIPEQPSYLLDFLKAAGGGKAGVFKLTGARKNPVEISKLLTSLQPIAKQKKISDFLQFETETNPEVTTRLFLSKPNQEVKSGYIRYFYQMLIDFTDDGFLFSIEHPRNYTDLNGFLLKGPPGKILHGFSAGARSNGIAVFTRMPDEKIPATAILCPRDIGATLVQNKRGAVQLFDVGYRLIGAEYTGKEKVKVRFQSSNSERASLALNIYTTPNITRSYPYKTEQASLNPLLRLEYKPDEYYKVAKPNYSTAPELHYTNGGVLAFAHLTDGDKGEAIVGKLTIYETHSIELTEPVEIKFAETRYSVPTGPCLVTMRREIDYIP